MGSSFLTSFSQLHHHFNSFIKNTTKGVLVVCMNALIFVSVFHRILDFKTGLYFYAGPFFMPLLYVVLRTITSQLK